MRRQLNLVFNASKEELRERDPQLYYAILGVINSATRPVSAKEK